MKTRTGSKIRKLMVSTARHDDRLSYYPIENVLSDGMPDAFALIQGKPVWIEHKSSNEKLRPAQRIWHEKYKKHGGRVVILREVEHNVFQIESHDGKIIGTKASVDMAKILLWVGERCLL